MTPEPEVVDARGAQPIIGYKPRYIVDTLSKRADFPDTVYPERRKLFWRVVDLRAWRDGRAA